LNSMREHLREQSNTSEDIPIIVQYNKRDLDDLLSEEELDRHFRFRDDVVTFPSVATEGQGVFEAFVEASVALVEQKVELYKLAADESAPREVAESVRSKLWSICDDVRRAREVVAVEDLPQTRFALSEDNSKPVVDEHDERDGDADVTLRDTAPQARADEGGEGDAAAHDDDDFDLAYTLRDSAEQPQAASPRSQEVLTDEELDLDLSAGLVDFVRDDDEAQREENEPSLLDKSVHSNLELARRFGELDEQRLLLQRKVDELVNVAQCTVHDLNRPISAVRLMLSTLRKGMFGELQEMQEQAVENGLMAVNQMERLVRDLLDSSRLDHDGMQLEFGECDLTLLVADVMRTLRYEFEEYGVQVRVEPLPVVKADTWALTKALMNLFGNAIAYRSEERVPMVRVFCEERDDTWGLCISDNGIGIPTQDRERLFRRFERGSNTGGISGTGLGLHIVKEIVQGHGGAVTFDSEVGRGTTFRLNLPKAPKLAPHSPVSDVAAKADL